MTSTTTSLLAFAVTTSLALANGGEEPRSPFQDKPSWKPGSGTDLVNTDEFQLNLTNLLQARWDYTDRGNDGVPATNDRDTDNFSIARARTSLSGHAFGKNLLYLLRIDAVDTQGTVLKDAWTQWNFVHDTSTIGLRFGQSKTGFGLESTGSESGLYFIDRAQASRTFADARNRGAWFHGTHEDGKVRWNAGLQNGDVASGATGLVTGEETDNPDSTLNFVANGSFDPLGDTTMGRGNEMQSQGDLGDMKDLRFSVGGGVEVGNNTANPGGGDIDSTAVNINTNWLFGGGLTAQGEVFLRQDDPQAVGQTQDSRGWYAMGTYTLEKSGSSAVQWGFGLRFGQVELEAPVVFVSSAPLATAGNVTELSAVLDAFYHGNACKTQIQYTWQDVNPDGAVVRDHTNHIFSVQFQLMF